MKKVIGSAARKASSGLRTKGEEFEIRRFSGRDAMRGDFCGRFADPAVAVEKRPVLLSHTG